MRNEVKCYFSRRSAQRMTCAVLAGALARLAASSSAAPPDGKMLDRSCKPLGYFGCFTRLRPCCFSLLCCQRGTVTTLVTARDALVMIFWPAKTPTS